MENKKKLYNEFSDSDQCEICQDFQETYYRNNTIEGIDLALKKINPEVEWAYGQIKIWAAYRPAFEKLLNESKPAPPSPVLPAPDEEGKEECEIQDEYADDVKDLLEILGSVPIETALEVAKWVDKKEESLMAMSRLDDKLSAANATIEALTKERDDYKAALEQVRDLEGLSPLGELVETDAIVNEILAKYKHHGCL